MRRFQRENAYCAPPDPLAGLKEQGLNKGGVGKKERKRERWGQKEGRDERGEGIRHAGRRESRPHGH